MKERKWLRENAHLSIREIMQHTGRSYGAVANARSQFLPPKHKRPRTRVTSEDREIARKLYASGESGNTIAKMMNRAQSTIWNILNPAA